MRSALGDTVRTPGPPAIGSSSLQPGLGVWTPVLCLRHFFCKGIGICCLEGDGTVQWQREGAWDIRTAKAFEAQGSPGFYHSERNQRDSVDKELNCVIRNGLNR